MSEDPRVVWPPLFEQVSRPRRGRGLSTLVTDVHYRKDLVVVRWLVVLNLLACATLVCVDGESWVTRSPLFTALGWVCGFVILVLILFLGLLWLLVPGDASVCQWAGDLLWSGGVEPYRSGLGLLAFILGIALLWRRYGKRFTVPAAWLRRGRIAAQVSLVLLCAAIGLRAAWGSVSTMSFARTAAQEFPDSADTTSGRVKGPLPEPNNASSLAPTTPVLEIVRDDASMLVLRLDTSQVKPSLLVASGFDGAEKVFPKASVQGLLSSESDWLAALPGGFFDPQTGGPIGPLYVGTTCIRSEYNGRAAGTLVVLTEQGLELHVRDCPGAIRDGIDAAFWSGPLLLHQGEVVVDGRGEGYRDRHLLGEARRAALGQDDRGRLVLFVVWELVSLERLAVIARDFGCVTAVNLDGGCSLFLAYRDEEGEVFCGHDTSLPYILVFRRRD